MREPARILVVDDVPDNVDILQMRLESQGYEAVELEHSSPSCIAATAAGLRDRWLADSPVEGAGFEPLVPP